MNCLAEGCLNPKWKRNLCSKHYFRTHKRVQEKNYKMTLAREVAELAGLSIPKALLIINTMIKTMVRTLRKGESVKIYGFGTFHVHNRSKFRYGQPCFFNPSKDLTYRVRYDYKGKD